MEYRTKSIGIDGESFPTLDAFFNSLRQQLSFPDYFNGNLNSFEEILNDLTWLFPEFRIVRITISGFKYLLRDEAPWLKEQVIDILRQAAEETENNRDSGKPELILEISD